MILILLKKKERLIERNSKGKEEELATMLLIFLKLFKDSRNLLVGNASFRKDTRQDNIHINNLRKKKSQCPKVTHANIVRRSFLQVKLLEVIIVKFTLGRVVSTRRN